MSARRATAGADLLSADAETCRVMAHEPYGALGVKHGRRVAEARCLAVIDSEDRVAASLHRFDVGQAQRRLFERAGVVAEGRVPTATVDVDHTEPLGVLGMVDIHQQGQAGMHAVDHITFDVRHSNVFPSSVFCQAQLLTGPAVYLPAWPGEQVPMRYPAERIASSPRPMNQKKPSWSTQP